MHTRSRRVEMPSGLKLPLAFGIYTRLIGSGRYFSSLSASASSPSHRSTPYASISSKFWPSTPVCPCSSGTVHRHAPGCLRGKSCRTARRTDSQVLSSLSRVTPSAAFEHFSELLGCPISCPSLLVASVLNQGPFPPPALPGFGGTTGLSVIPRRPAYPSPASGWSSPTTQWDFPCCARFPCVHAVATTPVQPLAALPCSSVQWCQPSPVWQPGRPAHRPFRGLLGVHTRYGLHTCAVTVFCDTLTRRLQPVRHLPVCSGASGWSIWPGGSCTHWKSAALSRRTP